MAADFADEKGDGTKAAGDLAAGDIGVETGKAVGQSLLDEEIQGPINRDRRHAAALGSKAAGQIICSDGPLGRMKGLENATADRGQPNPVGAA